MFGCERLESKDLHRFLKNHLTTNKQNEYSGQSNESQKDTCLFKQNHNYPRWLPIFLSRYI
jgi:hypothetical protein